MQSIINCQLTLWDSKLLFSQSNSTLGTIFLSRYPLITITLVITRGAPMSTCSASATLKQRNEINALLTSSPVSISELKSLSRESDGFLSNTLRSRVWPVILGVNRYHIPDYKRFVKVLQQLNSSQFLFEYFCILCFICFFYDAYPIFVFPVKVHRDAAQLRCDIDRSFWSLDCAQHWSKKRLARKRAALSDIITAVLVRNPSYYYFQVTE